MRVLLTVIVTSAAVAFGQSAGPSPDEKIFSESVAPLLQANCGSCHGGTSSAGELSMAGLNSLLRGGKHGPAIEPGNSKQSLLMQYIRGERTPRMPMGGSLSDDKANALAAAIDQMQALPKTAKKLDSHLDWLLQKPVAPAVPAVKNSAWVVNPIDAFILQKLEAKGMSPAPPASKRVLLRRVYFDLIGMPPTPEEVQEFETNSAPNAYENLIDKLLADPRYGERWARHWLDLARFAESDGFAIDGERPTAWRYRDYVIRAFNSDKPYDQFVQEQIAGDELPAPDGAKGGGPNRSERLVALGFLRMGTWEADANFKTQLRQDVLNELTGTVGQVFLGFTVGCARCHDHKYDPIPQRDFYRLQAFFAPMKVDNREAPFGDTEGGSKKMRDKLRTLEDEADEAEESLRKMESELRKQYQSKPPATADTVSGKSVSGAKEAAKPESRGDFMAALKNPKDAFFTEAQKSAWRAATDHARQAREMVARYRPVAYSVSDVVPPQVPDLAATYVLAGGELANRGERVEPGFLQAVVGNDKPAEIPFVGGSSGRRLALAEWIASSANPLTARVMVNRLWQHHFGEGIVRTPSDFGINGDRPSHPELLDYLATQFVEKKWSLKAMHRMMLLSNTYRQSTENPLRRAFAETDPKNQLLWRMNWIRLEGEEVRDSLLAVSGQLQKPSGGASVFVSLPDDVAGGFEFFKWFPSDEKQQARRTIYTFQRRSVMNPMIEVFDGANMSEVCSRRSTTVVPTQAFSLLNGDFTHSAARHFADRILETAGPDIDKQLDLAFLAALARRPSDAERSRYKTLYAGKPATESLARLGVVLFNLNEFLYLE
jgi:cytochrome c553